MLQFSIKNHFNLVILPKDNFHIKHIYIIKSGELDSRLSKVAKNCIHCVFSTNENHGDVYASISPWVKGNNGKYPVVPHMINLPKHNNNMREKLNIPNSAVVFGGYGGKDNFNIDYVKKTKVIRKLPLSEYSTQSFKK